MKALATGVFFLALLVAGASGDAQAAPSPLTNGRIVFSANGNGIATMNPDGSGVWGLFLGGSDGEPAWSPDGSRLALAVRWPGIEGITVMDPDGWTNRIRLTFETGDGSPSWSPDGTTIAYSRSGSIATVPAAGGATPTALTAGWYDTQPAWSPDGSSIVFVRYGAESGSGLWSVDVATRKVTRVTAGGSSYVGGASWSPSGELTYVRDTTAVVATADGETRPLVSRVDPQSKVVWAPDGTRFLFVRDGAVWAAEPDGKEVGRLTAGSQPAWQPLPSVDDGCTVRGTPHSDVLVGSSGNDVICGLDGNDTVLGLDGSDLLRGGGGDDWIAGGQGSDYLFGNDGDDRLDSRDGNIDGVHGGFGRDVALAEPPDRVLGVERRKVDLNLAAWRPVTASGATVPDPVERVVDGRADDYWNSGGWPPQWIEVDLQRSRTLARIRVIASPQPDGVKHLVLGKGAHADAYRLLGVVSGPTGAAQEVVLKAKQPWKGIRFIRIETQTGPNGAGWVAWHEIEAYAPVKRPRR